MEDVTVNKKPFILRVTSIIALTYHLVFLSIFLSGIVFNKFINASLDSYFPEGISQSEILYFCIFGTILYISSVTGLIYIRKMKRIGLIIFTSSILIYFTSKMFIWDISFINLIINITFVCIFALYIKRFS